MYSYRSKYFHGGHFRVNIWTIFLDVPLLRSGVQCAFVYLATGGPLAARPCSPPRRPPTSDRPGHQVGDYRTEFSRWWVNEFKSVKFPAQGTVFDYYIDSESQKFLPWSANVSAFELDPDMPLQVGN